MWWSRRKVEVELQRRGQLSGWLGSGGKGHQHSTQAWCPQGQLLQVRKGPSDPLGDCVRYRHRVQSAQPSWRLPSYYWFLCGIRAQVSVGNSLLSLLAIIIMIFAACETKNGCISC